MEERSFCLGDFPPVKEGMISYYGGGSCKEGAIINKLISCLAKFSGEEGLDKTLEFFRL